jgi:hypothetical protein
MSLIDIEDIKQKSFLGYPTLFKDETGDICLIQPLTIGDKIRLGPQYNIYLSLLTISNEDIEDLLKDKIGEEADNLSTVTPFEYLMLSAEFNDTFFMDLKKAFGTFIRDEVFIIPKAQEIRIGEISQGRKITKENFDDFQKIIRLQNHLDMPEEIPENENPMHKKFRLRRKELKKAKAKQNSQSEDAPTFSDLVSSMCAMQIGVTWNNISKMPIYTFYDLLSRSQSKEKYQMDTQALLAGADSKKIKLKYWIRNNSVEE